MKNSTYHKIIDNSKLWSYNVFVWAGIYLAVVSLPLFILALLGLNSSFPSPYYTFPVVIILSVPVSIGLRLYFLGIDWAKRNNFKPRDFWARYATVMECNPWKIYENQNRRVEWQEIQDWLDANTKHLYLLDQSSRKIYFLSKKDAMRYKLTW